MTQEDLKRRIERNSAVKTVSAEDGISAGLKLGELADEKNIAWAFAGGIAMHVYGYVRATVDVDVVANEVLGLESQKTLSFGGESYLVEIDEDSITVDWIVRDDEHEKFYSTALTEAVEIRNGVRVISPEWMVILKHLAGRPKDQLDLTWLLQENDLVDREQVVKNIEKVLGEHSVYLINPDYAIGFTRSFLPLRPLRLCEKLLFFHAKIQSVSEARP